MPTGLELPADCRRLKPGAPPLELAARSGCRHRLRRRRAAEPAAQAVMTDARVMRAAWRASAPACSTPTARCSTSTRRSPACAPQIGAQADALSQLWRTKQLEYTWLRALMGRHADFWQVTGDALDYALARTGVDAGGCASR